MSDAPDKTVQRAAVPVARWARVRLSRGDSWVKRWEADETQPRDIVVGAAAGCDWRVRAPGVQDEHLKLRWDGQRLTASALAGATITVDGQPLDGARVLSGYALIALGDAVLVAQTWQPDPRSAGGSEHTRAVRQLHAAFDAPTRCLQTPRKQPRGGEAAEADRSPNSAAAPGAPPPATVIQPSPLAEHSSEPQRHDARAERDEAKAKPDAATGKAGRPESAKPRAGKVEHRDKTSASKKRPPAGHDRKWSVGVRLIAISVLGVACGILAYLAWTGRIAALGPTVAPDTPGAQKQLPKSAPQAAPQPRPGGEAQRAAASPPAPAPEKEPSASEHEGGQPPATPSSEKTAANQPAQPEPGHETERLQVEPAGAGAREDTARGPSAFEAASHLVAGRRKQARAAYQRLVRTHPDARVYQAITELLQRQNGDCPWEGSKTCEPPSSR